MHSVDEYEMFMSEIHMDKQGADQQTNGDAIMVTDDVTISKFSNLEKLSTVW